MSATIDINDLAAIGLILDQPGYQLPPEAWTLAENVRYVDDSVQRLYGETQVFGTPSVAPHFLLPLSTAATQWWIYTSLVAAYAYDGATHTDITRAAGASPYTASNTRDWNGTIIGGIAVLNNGTDLPQYWATASAGTDLANITATSDWPATTRAKIIRALGPVLIAFNITDAGTNKPHLVRFSHPADPGSMPAFWDVALPAKDTGENSLPDVNSGIIVDALSLGGNMYVYKESSVWRMVPVGGRFIFDFKTFLETAGILAPRCVTMTGDGLYHVVATQDDIILHNGNNANSILDKRMKRALFNQIDNTNYLNSFMFTNAPYNEVWFCYPSSGQTHPDRALIWNYKTNKVDTDRIGLFSEASGISFRNVAAGNIIVSSDETWASDAASWDSDTTSWSTVQRRKLVACKTNDTKLVQFDIGTQRDGVDFTATLQRTGIAIIGRKRNGEWIVDHEVKKLLTRLWPKIRGGPVRIRIGSQQVVDGPVSWGAYMSFDPTLTTSPSSGMTDDTVKSGRAISIEISTTSAVQWTADGYKIELAQLGRF